MGSKNPQENQALTEIVSDDELQEIIDPMVIKSTSEAFQMVDWIIHFSQQHGHAKVDQSLMKASEKVQDIHITGIIKNTILRHGEIPFLRNRIIVEGLSY